MSTDSRARELADEIMRPIGQRVTSLESESGRNLMDHMRNVVERGQEQALYDSQKGWQKK